MEGILKKLLVGVSLTEIGKPCPCINISWAGCTLGASSFDIWRRGV
jgi:hypothetical protein